MNQEDENNIETRLDIGILLFSFTMLRLWSNSVSLSSYEKNEDTLFSGNFYEFNLRKINFR